MIRVGMVSLGCPKNQVDAERMLYLLRNDGYELVSDAALSDVVIINTCGFIESAKSEAIETILEFCTLKQEGRIKAVIVTGCLAERYKDEILKEIPEVDAVIGIGSNEKICGVITDVCKGKNITLYGGKEDLCFDDKRIISTPGSFAFIKIAEGCNNCCTYCAIPSIRGRFRSRRIEDIVKEAEGIAKQGFTELVVVAQDTTRYGEDIYGETKLPELLHKLCEIDGLKWIRTLYMYPERITDELIDTIAREEKLVKYMDIPIQHCNSQVLKRMNRKGDKQSLVDLINKIRTKIPDIVLRTTLITGFPGETEEQFEELCEFVDEMQFERLGCFAYSQEEGTPAADFPDQIDEDIKEHRCEIIYDMQQRISDKFNQSLLGSELEIVVEGFDRYAECFFGRSYMDAPDIDGKVFFTSANKLSLGEYVRVKVNDILDYDLLGEHI